MARILVVEDDRDFFQMLCDFLRPMGHELVQAMDAACLCAVLPGFPPDLVILDFHLPGGGAPAAMRALQNSPAHSGTPVLVCSGMPVRHQKEWFPENPSRRYVCKPADMAEIVGLVAELLDREAEDDR